MMDNPLNQEGVDYTTPCEIAEELAVPLVEMAEIHASLHAQVMKLSGRIVKEIRAGNIAKHFDELSELNDMSALLAITSSNANKVLQSCGNLMKIINTHVNALHHESLSYALVFSAYKVGKLSAQDMQQAYEKVNEKFRLARARHRVTLELSQSFHTQLNACYRTLIELGKRIDIDQ